MKPKPHLMIRTALLIVSLSLFLFSCDEEDAAGDSQGITSAEAAEDIGATLASDVVSMNADVSAMEEVALEGTDSEARVASCGISYDTTIVSDYEGTYVTFNNTIEYSYELACNGNFPQSLSYSFSSDGYREGVKLSATGTNEGDFSATGFELSSSSYVLNGSFERESVVIQKVGAQKTFTGKSTISLTEMKVNKSSLMITSGTGTVTLKGTSSTGASFDYSSSVVFNGDETATITLNNGSKYLVNLKTGQVTEL